MKRRFFGLLLAGGGAYLLLLQFLWTTGERSVPAPLPPFLVSAVVFALGLIGLALVTLGVAVLFGGMRGKP